MNDVEPACPNIAEIKELLPLPTLPHTPTSWPYTACGNHEPMTHENLFFYSL